VRQIISDNYTDQPDGLPGNDDSGAMSSWLAFHMLGLYPNAGQSYYLLHAPLISDWTLQLSNGKSLHGIIKGKGTHFEKVMLNGKVLDDARLEHDDLMQGGELTFYVSAKRPKEASYLFPAWEPNVPTVGTFYSQPGNKKASIAFTLNRQHRTWPLTYGWQGDTLIVTCKEATYKTARSIVENGEHFCWDIPADGAVYEAKGTFAFISRQAMRELREKGYTVYDGIIWRKIDESDVAIHAQADIDRTEMWIRQDDDLPLVLEMRNNPLGINWQIE
jgi:hypothetical protein